MQILQAGSKTITQNIIIDKLLSQHLTYQDPIADRNSVWFDMVRGWTTPPPSPPPTMALYVPTHYT